MRFLFQIAFLIELFINGLSSGLIITVLVGSKLNKCNKVSPPIKHEGRIIIHPSEKCDIFNKYFADISNIENEPNLPNEDFARDNICPEHK
jgi:hypothetical protein